MSVPDSWVSLLRAYIGTLDAEGDIEISGLPFAPSVVLREVAPIAYWVGLLDYAEELDVDTDEFRDWPPAP